ncbi:ABC-type amino acid transport system, permease component [Mesorhizobium australicum WSM2073]|uniref:ABC-type amino acid transport system, permease component n=3 Tax=Mesorhizobium TaxID=68287 RepID=L0KVQ4_MESAW|nr:MULTISPECIES: amino acid ABC transporter permease [Mesorhizobium]ADV14801.1 polar amino acid ABC transporter, inner membrane subunit [Mesorhizobium ciceri biovar biserrulae WSM1271]AEH90688.1 polar amino acid ABC transporter, inner membrane subunit [Mesorhizobium opportunistum WSM2075]AGB48059.1 ABC-type amino acid transport system, permease component [Mesorhizobium australicum WSM2073]OBP89853.1 polar amino acid ABC transporter permease [Mesorhizobium loti]
MHLDWGIIWEYRALLFQGLGTTLRISLISIALSFLIGSVVGCLKVTAGFHLRKSLDTCVEVIRDIPVVVKLFAIYYAFGIDASISGVIALTLHQGAYISDVVTSGIRALPTGQWEAGIASGLSGRQVFTRIILPQAIRITVPPLTSQFIQVVKNSSTVMLIAIEDLTFMTQQIEQETFRGMEAAIAVTVLYLMLALLIAGAMSAVQVLMDRERR